MTWMNDKRSRAALALSAGLLLAAVVGSPAARAEDRCPGADTTLALLECLGRRLQETDQALARSLDGVAASARQDPSDATFQTLWQRFSEGLLSGSDPRRQLRAFQRERRQICQYILSMSLRGSGFGVFVLSCELDLSEALLRQIRN